MSCSVALYKNKKLWLEDRSWKQAYRDTSDFGLLSSVLKPFLTNTEYDK